METIGTPSEFNKSVKYEMTSVSVCAAVWVVKASKDNPMNNKAISMDRMKTDLCFIITT